ncbi:DUF2652 domain-containing protein [Sphingobacterium faecium]|jgi:hypothetical protein|uniref:DUF2652 domain-containing protein n=1 Tax=Sphingobacterium faecium TaxID=34087 RepID=UPI0021B5C675|nr:DUF2652 domain-containing protein [Sphingobacterium faecium]UXD69396.1 DUF2652 domain-containing protein [Sphingobacterium faecium]
MFEDKKGLVFIVDISGYSQFIREMSPDVGILVIRHLLKGIIDSNFLSFKISEIEGDAILFYHLGLPPSVKDMLKQFDHMRTSFKKIWSRYSLKYPNMINLDLKAIVHYGTLIEFKINRFCKLYGNIMVDAHRLLKNSVPSNTYLLLTTDYLEEIGNYPLDYYSEYGTYQCDIYDVGSLCYRYFSFNDAVFE